MGCFIESEEENPVLLIVRKATHPFVFFLLVVLHSPTFTLHPFRSLVDAGEHV